MLKDSLANQLLLESIELNELIEPWVSIFGVVSDFFDVELDLFDIDKCVLHDVYLCDSASLCGCPAVITPEAPISSPEERSVGLKLEVV